MKLENKKSSCPQTSLFILFFFHLHTWNCQKLECLFNTEAFNCISNNLINSFFIKSVTGRSQNCLIPKLEFYIRCNCASGCFVLHTHKRGGCDVWPFYSSSYPWGGGGFQYSDSSLWLLMSSIQCETRLESDALKHTALSQTVQGAPIAQPADLQAVMMAGGLLCFMCV